MTSATNHNLYDLFRSRFPSDRDMVFLNHDGPEITYANLDQLTGQYATALSTLGVTKGERVLVQVPKSAQAVLLYLACLRIGAIYIPLNTAYTLNEVAYFVTDAGPKTIVCDPASLADFERAFGNASVSRILTLDADGTGSLAELAQQPKTTARTAHCAPDDLAAILYTSGTTGRSKGAMLTHANLATNALTLHDLWGWQPGDVLLHALPIFHVHGLFVALHCALLNGSTVLFHNGFDAKTVATALPNATIFMGVPTFYTRLLDDNQFDQKTCRNIRLFISGSAPLLAENFEKFKDRTGHRILERYGMTEAGMITSNPLNGDRVPGSVGFALPGVDVRVAGPDGKTLPNGDVGILEIKGPNVFVGYWKMPEKTALEFRDDGYFITGDMAVMDDTGRISIVGRSKDLIITGGYNVYPKEIETQIDQIAGVAESAVIGLPDPDLGEMVTAVVTLEPGARLEKQTIDDRLAKRVARFKQPKQVFFVSELPRNTMGKVQKNILREQFAPPLK